MTRIKHNGATYQIEGSADIDDNGRFRRGTGWHVNIVHWKGDHEEVAPTGAWFETKDQAIAAVTE